MNALRSMFFAAVILLSVAEYSVATACEEDRRDLSLNRIGSIQIAGTVIAPTEIRLALDAVNAPFMELLSHAGIKIDQNNYNNVIRTTVEVATTTARGVKIYAVSMSTHYDEQCVVKRLQTDFTCHLWEHTDLVQFFENPNDVRSYVMNKLSAWSKEFGALVYQK